MTLREQHAQYYGHVSAIDHEIGRIRNHLHEIGCADNTVFIYTSDHGEMLGSQGLLRKGQFYQESARVPFIAEGPGIDPRGESTLMSTIDVYPTLLGFAGSHDHEGRGVDCTSALAGKPETGLREALHFFSRDPHQRLGIRTAKYLYFGRPEQEFLYDTEADPFEMRNVAGDPGYREIRRELVDHMRRKIDHAWSYHPWES
jgi:arylsulfatase A-like enzyme